MELHAGGPVAEGEKSADEQQPKLDFASALIRVIGGMVLGWALWKLWSGF